MADGTVTIKTDLDNSGFDSGMTKLKTAGKKGAQILAGAFIAATAAVAAVGVSSFKVGKDFEDAFAGVKKTVDATDGQLAQLRDGLRDLSQEMPQTASELAGIAEAAGQLGIKTSDIISFTKTMAMLGDATNLTSEEAATMLARFANITQMDAQNFDRLGSVIVDLGNNFATTEAEITGMGMRLAGAGKQVGLTEPQIMAFAASLTSLGIEAEAGGTAFSTVMSKMALAVERGGQDLADFASVAGMSVDDFKVAFEKDAAGAIMSFIGGLDKAEAAGSSAILMLDDMGLSQQRMRDVLTRATGGMGIFTDALARADEAWGSNTALIKEAAQRYETTSSKISMLKNTFADLGISIYDNAFNPMRDVLDESTKMANGLKKAFENDGFTGLAKAAGQALADIVTKTAEAAPQMISKGSAVLKSFVDGIVSNKGKILDAAKTIVASLGDGIANLFPAATQKTIHNMTSVISGLVKPFANAAGAALKTANALAPLAPAIIAVTVAAKGWSTFKTMSDTLKATRIQLISFTASSETLTTTTKLGTAATSAATAATNGLKAAFATNPIGLIVTAASLAIGALIPLIAKMNDANAEAEKDAVAIKKLGDAAKEMADDVKAMGEARSETMLGLEGEALVVDDLADKVENLAAKENKSAAEKQLLKQYVDELNEKVPDLGLAYDDVTDSLNKTTDEIRKNIDAMLEQAQAQALTELYMESLKKVPAATNLVTETETKLAEQTKKTNAARKAAADLTQGAIESDWKYELRKKTLNEALMKEEKNERAAIKAHEDASKALSDLTANSESLEAQMEMQALGFEALTAEAEKAGIKIPENVTKGIDAGKYAVPAKLEELQALIDYEAMVTKAGEAGAKIPEDIAAGIKAGELTPQEAILMLEELTDFGGMVTKANAAGVSVPAGLAESIKAGKLTPAQAVQEVKDLIKFDDMLNSATGAGRKEMENIKAAIDSGKTLPSDALKQALDLSSKDNEAKAKKDGETVGKAKTSAIAKGISDAGEVGKVNAASKEVVGKAINSGKSEAAKASGVGSNFSGGIATGIYNGQSGVVNAATVVIRAAVAAAQRAQDSHSPAKVLAKEVGQPFSQGVAVGIEQERGLVVAAAADTVRAGIDAAESAAAGFDLASVLSGHDVDALAQDAKQTVAVEMSLLPKSAQELTARWEDYGMSGGGEYTIITKLDVDGREFAEATAVYNDEALATLQRERIR
jgi:TP901 family phage tail tape measure protein